MKRKTTHRILAVLLGAAVLTAGLSGCGGDDQGQTEEVSESTDVAVTAEPAASDVTEAPSTVEPSTDAETQTPSTEPVTESKPQETKAPVQEEKKGDLYKVVGADKIWANLVGEAYILFKNTDEPIASGINGKVYELYVLVAQTGDDYVVWSDGYWDLNDAGDTLKLTPHNQNENGNIGVSAGETKTYTKSGNVFNIAMSFSGGGNVNFEFDPSADALQ